MRVRALTMVAVAFCAASWMSFQTPPSSAQAVTVRFPAPSWVAVAYGNGEVSVPPSFGVFYTGQKPSCALVPGVVLVGLSLSCPAPNPSRTLVQLLLQQMPTALKSEKPSSINGVPVYPGPRSAGTLRYYAPSLGLEIVAQGHLAAQIINTLTPSPREVALGAGEQPQAPATWRAVSFGGLRFSVPSGWPVTHRAIVNVPGNPCRMLGAALGEPQVSLSTDTRPFIRNFMCALIAPTPFIPVDGVQLDSGHSSQTLVPLTFSAPCMHVHGLRICAATAPAFSILFLKITVPGRTGPLAMAIGLANSGEVARTILYSLQSA